MTYVKVFFFPIINGYLCSFFRAGDDVRVPDSVQKDWRAKGGRLLGLCLLYS